MAILNITNFDDHPENPNWIVFRFPNEGMAAEFKAGLDEAGISHERDEQGGPPFLIGVKQRHREAAVRINYRVLGRHRSPFIADSLFRWIIIGFVAAVIALAIIGAMRTG